MRRTLVTLTAAVALLTAACSGGDTTSSTDAANSSETRVVKIGSLPVLSTGTLLAGEEQGFFEERGLEVDLQTSQGGAAVVPAVSSGQVDFGSANPISLMQARERGIDLKIVSHWSSSQSEGNEKESSAVLAMPDSGIEGAAGLVGKTVAVNTLRNLGELVIREAVKLDGGDPDAVQFVEMGFADMPGALANGSIDAAWSPEPFFTIMLDGGAEVVSYANNDAIPGMPSQMFFTSADLVEKDPEFVRNVRDAINDSQDYVEENPDALKEAAQEFLDMDADLLDRMLVEEYGSDLRRAQIERTAELMVEHGIVDEMPDVEGLFADL